MNKRAYRKNIIKLIVIALIAFIIVAAFDCDDNNSICNRSGNDNISVCY